MLVLLILLLGVQPPSPVLVPVLTQNEGTESETPVEEDSKGKVKLRPEPRLAERPVAWRINSTPSGATVQLDGKPVGRTPWSGAVTAGAHEIRLSLAGFAPYTGLAHAPTEVAAVLTPLPVGFRLQLEPVVPVRVTVDTQTLEPEGGLFAVGPGRHVVEVAAPGFVTVRTILKTVLGVIELPVKLVAAPKEGLSVASTPAGAEVWLDDEKVGVTPWSGATPTAGEHRVRVTLPGYAPASLVLLAPARKKAQPPWFSEQNFTLEALPVSVAIETSPPGARVFLDGEPRGETPLMVLLPEGNHRVYLTHDGFETVDVVKTVTPATSPRWSWLLVSNEPLPKPTALPEPPPPSTPPQKRTVDLGDPKASLAEKQAQLSEVLEPARLLEQVRTAQPADHQLALCRALTTRMPVSPLEVRSVDVNDELVPARVVVDGTELGRTPFTGLVPACAETVKVLRDDGGFDQALKLEPGVTRRVIVKEGGRVRFSTVSLTGDLQIFAEPVSFTTLPRPPDPTSALIGGGLRWDRWGTLFHGTIGLTAQQLYSPIISAYLNTELPIVPSLDLFLGLHFRAGGKGVTGLFGLDVGIWQWVHPTARLNLGLRAGPLVFVVSADARYLWLFTEPILPPAPSIGANPLTFGSTASLGLAW